MLSLLEAALSDERTTHVLFCTESCIPITTLKEAAKSILLDQVCAWNEDDHAADSSQATTSNDANGRPHWDRSYVDCYDRNSHRCTRFDERKFQFAFPPVSLALDLPSLHPLTKYNDEPFPGNCWDVLAEAIPGEAVYKA